MLWGRWHSVAARCLVILVKPMPATLPPRATARKWSLARYSLPLLTGFTLQHYFRLQEFPHQE